MFHQLPYLFQNCYIQVTSFRSLIKIVNFYVNSSGNLNAHMVYPLKSEFGSFDPINECGINENRYRNTHCQDEVTGF